MVEETAQQSCFFLFVEFIGEMMFRLFDGLHPRRRFLHASPFGTLGRNDNTGLWDYSLRIAVISAEAKRSGEISSRGHAASCLGFLHTAYPLEKTLYNCSLFIVNYSLN